MLSYGSPRRIHVIGASGSGKTTLARELAGRLDVPYHGLDAVGYEGGAGAKRSLELRQADLARIVAQPGWVTEGAFLWWVEDLLQHADAIVWLDLHWSVCYRRIVIRHLKADLARNNPHPGFLNMLRFAAGVRSYCLDPQPAVPAAPDDDHANRAAVVLALAPYMDKVIHCRHPEEARRFLARAAGVA